MLKCLTFARPCLATLAATIMWTSQSTHAATTYMAGGVGSGGQTYNYFDARSYAGVTFKLKSDVPHGSVRAVSLGDVEQLDFSVVYLLRDFPGQFPHAVAQWEYHLADFVSFEANVLASTPNSLIVLGMRAWTIDKPNLGNARIPYASAFLTEAIFATIDPSGRSFGSGVFFGLPEPSTWAFMLAGFGLIGTGLRRSKAALDRSTLPHSQ